MFKAKNQFFQKQVQSGHEQLIVLDKTNTGNQAEYGSTKQSDTERKTPLNTKVDQLKDLAKNARSSIPSTGPY